MATSSSQASFFQNTTLPLVDELLQGHSGLIFAYGVTNSGKSYTVQGGNGEGQSGILPRSMDVIFNSVKGLESTSDVRPHGLAGVELAQPSEEQARGINPFSLPGLSKCINSGEHTPSFEHEPTKLKVDRNYRYSVWISYVEVYNEKIFDLLDASPPAATNTPSSAGMTRSESTRGASNWSLAPSSIENNNGPIYLQRKPLPLKNDAEAGGKYVGGVQEIRVHSSKEANELVRRGQENRRVFATMANRASSRSHGVFTVKIIREHAGEDDWTVACSTSRLNIVDLAGSERLGNTAASGDRLKEAGSINKSLMCLGQCLETLRKNQARAASFIPSLSADSSKSTSTSALPRLLKRRPSIVPFRHSKLTELFQSFFTGEGRAVMIVNVNPYDTGFDENAHVMKFSAAAKEVHTPRTPGHATNLSRFVHPSLRNLFHGQGNATPPPPPRSSNVNLSYLSTPKVGEQAPKAPHKLPRTPSLDAHPQLQEIHAAMSEGSESHEVTILEGSDDEGDDDCETDPFVEHLMQKHEEMRQLVSTFWTEKLHY